MSDEHVFVDTNILVYAHDLSAKEKRTIAIKLIETLWNRPYPPAISVQVAQEFYVNLIKKKVNTLQAQQVLANYLCWEVIENTVAIFSQALEIQNRYKLSFWDASIISAAKSAKAKNILSEDLSDGQKYDGIQVVNPFR